MKILNIATIPNRKIEEIVDFITDYTVCSTLAVMIVLDSSHGSMSEGVAETGITLYNTIAVVKIFIKPEAGRKFPYSDRYVSGAPTLRIRTFEEELVAVIAHELRHIDQFFHLSSIPKADREVDAEIFANKMLAKWREKNKVSSKPKGAKDGTVDHRRKRAKNSHNLQKRKNRSGVQLRHRGNVAA